MNSSFGTQIPWGNSKAIHGMIIMIMIIKESLLKLLRRRGRLRQKLFSGGGGLEGVTILLFEQID